MAHCDTESDTEKNLIQRRLLVAHAAMSLNVYLLKQEMIYGKYVYKEVEFCAHGDEAVRQCWEADSVASQRGTLVVAGLPAHHPINGSYLFAQMHSISDDLRKRD
jgi:hypothetical protein